MMAAPCLLLSRDLPLEVTVRPVITPPDGPVTTASMARLKASVAGRYRSCGYGAESSELPADPNSARFVSVSGSRVTDPSIEPSSRSPTSMARQS
jgi:hypothetical protein